MSTRYARFVPQAATQIEAFERGTRIPRDIRQLGDALTAWSLANLAHDAVSPHGDLPRRFGFDSDGLSGAPIKRVPYHIALTPALRLYVTERCMACLHEAGSTILTASRFEVLHTAPTSSAEAMADPSGARPPLTPFQWALGWASLSRAFALLARYERWVIDTIGVRYRFDGERDLPRVARRTAVAIPQLPQALDSLAEWCGDGETAMLTWVIMDARRLGIEPVLPQV
jgi:hypothetical protein